MALYFLYLCWVAQLIDGKIIRRIKIKMTELLDLNVLMSFIEWLATVSSTKNNYCIVLNAKQDQIFQTFPNSSRYFLIYTPFCFDLYCIINRGCSRGTIRSNIRISLFNWTRNLKFFPVPRQKQLSRLIPNSSCLIKLSLIKLNTASISLRLS